MKGDSDESLRVIAVGDISFGDHYFSMGHGPRGNILKSGAACAFESVKDILKNIINS